MNFIFIIVTCAVVIALLPIAFRIAIQVIWNFVEIPYRVVMLAVYASAYVLISIWEAIVWTVKCLGRIGNWLFGR